MSEPERINATVVVTMESMGKTESATVSRMVEEDDDAQLFAQLLVTDAMGAIIRCLTRLERAL